jgi:hypothetical protein
MYGPPLCRKRKTKVTGWSAQMYPAFAEHKLIAALVEPNQMKKGFAEINADRV